MVRKKLKRQGRVRSVGPQVRTISRKGTKLYDVKKSRFGKK